MQKIQFHTREIFGFVFDIEVQSGSFKIQVESPDGCRENFSGPTRERRVASSISTDADSPASQPAESEEALTATFSQPGKIYDKRVTMIDGYILPDGTYEYYMEHLQPTAGGPGYKIDCPVTHTPKCVEYRRRAPRWFARCSHCARTHGPSEFRNESHRLQFFSFWLHDGVKPFGVADNTESHQLRLSALPYPR